MSLTTALKPGYSRLKRGLAALKSCLCCHFLFWPEAPPSTDLPIRKSVVFAHPGCQLGSNYRSSCYVPKPKRPRYESELRRDKVRNKTRICIGGAFDRWRRLKAEKNLKTDANVADFLLDR